MLMMFFYNTCILKVNSRRTEANLTLQKNNIHYTKALKLHLDD
jgi:hypothetical protein